MMASKAFTIVLVLCSIYFSSAQDLSSIPSSQLRAEHRSENCDCMEYWDCVMSGGSTYSYCGLSETSVCCLIPVGATHNVGFKPGPETTKPKCGVKGFDSGRDGVADPSEWPWHVAVIEDSTYFYVCGGTLIDEFWVMTAAHCVDDYVNSQINLKVRLGEFDVGSSKESLPHEDRKVKKIILHKNFDNHTLANDIALLQLQVPAKQRTHIDIVCLPTMSMHFDEQTKCAITGWGRLSEGSQHSQILKEIMLPLWNDSICQESLKKEFGEDYRLPDTSICAGAQGRDACDGDGGGPLVCMMDGQWFQVGVVSYGIGCGQKDTPGVYTKVAIYEKWIKDTVLPTKFKP